MIILRKLFSLQEEIDRLRKMHPDWSESQINTKLKFSAKTDKLVSRMGNKSSQVKLKVTKYIKHPVYFSNTDDLEDNLEQRSFGKIGDKIKNHFIRKYEESAPEDKELFEKILKDNHKESNIDKIRFAKNYDAYKGNKTIELRKKTIDRGDFSTLAHEMGHAYHDTNKKSKLGRAFHKLDEKINDKYYNFGISSVGREIEEKYKDHDFTKGIPKELEDKIRNVSKTTKKVVGSSVSGLSGVVAGYKAEEEKEKGNKKKANIIKASGLAVPILGHTPELGREISASHKGMKMIKKAGASKQQIKGARKSLGYALGTYGVGLGKNLLINEGGQLAGKGAYKLTHEKKKDDNKN